MIAMRRVLDQYPELSMQERETISRVKAFLRENTPVRIVECKGWFYAVKPDSDLGSRSIAFRADMDTLPIQEDGTFPYTSTNDGVSHKCRNNGHCAALCRLALVLEETPPCVDRLPDFPGKRGHQGRRRTMHRSSEGKGSF